jgi:hypothetical protein
VTLKYTDIYLLNHTGGIATYEYSGNAVTSPDPAAPTQQPLYFDRYAALYAMYVVLGARINLKVSVDTGSNQCVAIAMFPYYRNDVTSSIGGLREACEQPYSKHTLLVNNPVKFEQMSINMQSSTLLATTRQALQIDPDYWTDTALVPDKEWYFKLIAANVDGTTTAFGLAIEAHIEYDVVFKQWKDEAPSRLEGKAVRYSSRGRELPCVITKENLSDLSMKDEPRKRSARRL